MHIHTNVRRLKLFVVPPLVSSPNSDCKFLVSSSYSLEVFSYLLFPLSISQEAISSFRIPEFNDRLRHLEWTAKFFFFVNFLKQAGDLYFIFVRCMTHYVNPRVILRHLDLDGRMQVVFKAIFHRFDISLLEFFIIMLLIVEENVWKG